MTINGSPGVKCVASGDFFYVFMPVEARKIALPTICDNTYQITKLIIVKNVWYSFILKPFIW